ncbi:M15 family peptidase [Psychromonas sp. RZ22]|uniref:M15 family metallopeptidase n=1 Tax=Psychromonas algarum TaxID=2555643 RepID=UPI00106845E6|nr:M15 family metallopeptidase [Psychromonas sp. RZ22]TEW56499.1 M15 family peptidase [Psychromonas sp. RZ22]
MRLLYTAILLPFIISIPKSEASISPLTAPQCQEMRDKNIISQTAPIPCKRLKVITFQHINFKGEQKQGKLMVLDAVAPYVDNIMQQLYAMKFPIHQAKLIQHFQGDDELSMTANNTSAFNYRKIAGKKSVSLHAYGVAIDINPLQNPFVSFTSWGTATFKPLLGYQYLNRKQYRLGKAASEGFAEQVIDVFAQNGFRVWGGDWNSPIDFQHFQTTREMAILMAKLSSKNSQILFKNHVDWYQQCLTYSKNRQQTLTIRDYSSQLKADLKKLNINSRNLSHAYQQAPTDFIKVIKHPEKANLTLCFN